MSDHAIGVTPILLRRAAYYLTLGVGEHEIKGESLYDTAKVEVSYPLTQNPESELEWSQGIKVSFYKSGRCIRWVEFGCRTVGAGGDPIIKEVK